MANYNSNLHPENDTWSVVFPNINGQSIPENAVTPSKVAAGQFPQIVAGSVQNPLTIVTAEGQTEYDGSDAATIDISSIQDADHAYTADRAGYISKRSFLNGRDTGAGWYKIMDFSCSSTGYDVYSCILLVNGIYNTQNIETVEGGKAPSGLLEIDLRAGKGGANGQIAPGESCLSILAGNLDVNSLALTFSGKTASLYIRHYTAIPQYQFVVLGERGEYEDSWTSAFTSEFIGTSAPSGAEYATVRNGADHLVLPAAVGSATTPVYFDANGVPKPCALPVSKYYNHTFTYQPSKLVQKSDFSFIFSVVLDVETPIPAGNSVLWGAYLNLPQTSLAPMPSNSKFFPATGIIKQDGQVGRIMGVGLAAQPLGVNLIASIYYEYNGTTGVYPASNSHVVLDQDRISESVVTP